VELFNPFVAVHAQTAFDYSLSNSGKITVFPGGSGSNNITATLLEGIPSNVTLSCIDATLPLGASCSFIPKSVTPTVTGNSSTLIVTTSPFTSYGKYNVSVTAGPQQTPLSPTNFTLTVGAKIAINPTNLSLPDYHGRVSFQVNITGSPPFQVFELAFNYNPRVLSNPSIEYSGNVLGTDTQIVTECIGGNQVNDPSNPPCTLVLGVDGPGVIHFGLITVNGENSTGNPTNGKLFNVNFDAAGTGFASLHLLYLLFATSTNTLGTVPIEAVPVDGYFANIDCGGNPCRPPAASFRPLSRPVAGRSIVFGATAVSQNCCPKGNITLYTWFFGSGAGTSSLSSKFSNATTFYSTASVDVPVTLLVNDTYGATAYVTNLITVIRIWVDLGILPLTIGQLRGVIPGTVNPVRVSVFNFGVDPENSTVRLLVNDNLLMTSQVENLQPTTTASFAYSWNTAGLTPRVYRLAAILDPVRDIKTGLVIENDTDARTLKDQNGMAVAYIQLIQVTPSGFGLFLGLGLPQTIALGIIVLAAIGFAQTFARRVAARRRQPE